MYTGLKRRVNCVANRKWIWVETEFTTDILTTPGEMWLPDVNVKFHNFYSVCILCIQETSLTLGLWYICMFLLPPKGSLEPYTVYTETHLFNSFLHTGKLQTEDSHIVINRENNRLYLSFVIDPFRSFYRVQFNGAIYMRFSLFLT